MAPSAPSAASSSQPAATVVAAAAAARTTVAVAAARALLFSTAVVIVLWTFKHLGGVSWSPQRDPATGRVVSTSLLFNYHPILMSVAFLVCAGEALLAYHSRAPLPLLLSPPPSSSSAASPARSARKAAHASLHAAALALALLGSTAAWRSHSFADPPIPHLYSPHSWLGLTAMLLFFAQGAVGAGVYLRTAAAGAPAPSGLQQQQQHQQQQQQPDPRRASFSPWHRLMGLCAFFAALAAIATGLQEKATFAQAFGKADVRGGAVRLAALAELGVLASGMAVGAVFYFGGSGGSGSGGGGGGVGGYPGGGREEEGLLPPRGG